MTTMMRPATPEDAAALLAIGQASGLFEAAEMAAFAAAGAWRAAVAGGRGGGR